MDWPPASMEECLRLVGRVHEGPFTTIPDGNCGYHAAVQCMAVAREPATLSRRLPEPQGLQFCTLGPVRVLRSKVASMFKISRHLRSLVNDPSQYTYDSVFASLRFLGKRTDRPGEPVADLLARVSKDTWQAGRGPRGVLPIGIKLCMYCTVPVGVWCGSCWLRGGGSYYIICTAGGAWMSEQTLRALAMALNCHIVVVTEEEGTGVCLFTLYRCERDAHPIFIAKRVDVWQAEWKDSKDLQDVFFSLSTVYLLYNKLNHFWFSYMHAAPGFTGNQATWLDLCRQRSLLP